MKRKKLSVGQKPVALSFDPVIADALANLKKLAQAGDDHLRVMQDVAELRKKGVSHRVLAECCGVTTRTIANWQTQGASSNTNSTFRNPKGRLPTEHLPKMQIIDVVQPERTRSLWPKINLRAEWARMRFNLEFV